MAYDPTLSQTAWRRSGPRAEAPEGWEALPGRWHVVADIVFTPHQPGHLAPVVCSCGVRTIVDFYKEHKADPTTPLPDPGPLRHVPAPPTRFSADTPYIVPRRRSQNRNRGVA